MVVGGRHRLIHSLRPKGDVGEGLGGGGGSMGGCINTKVGANGGVGVEGGEGFNGNLR